MKTDLSELSCKPLKGSENRLSALQCQQYLERLDGWQLAELGQAIRKTVPFEDYYRTMAFVNALAYIANREDHHPDLGVHYNRCEIRLSTHDVGGLSMNDFICAAKIDRLLAAG